MKRPGCKFFDIKDKKYIPDEFKGKVNISDNNTENYRFEYHPRNNSCPYINHFISNPDLPKKIGHKKCVDYYLY